MCRCSGAAIPQTCEGAVWGPAEVFKPTAPSAGTVPVGWILCQWEDIPQHKLETCHARKAISLNPSQPLQGHATFNEGSGTSLKYWNLQTNSLAHTFLAANIEPCRDVLKGQ